MRKIFFTYYTGLCGCDGHEVQDFENDVTDEELDRHAWEGALSNAEAYGIYNIEGSWQPYVAEKHEGYL